MSESTDQTLIRRANRGDAGALEALYGRHRDWVLAVAVRFTGNRDDALDVLQEVFAYFFGKFPGFKLTTSVRGFLFPAIRHKAISEIRRRQKVIPLAEARGAVEERLTWHDEPVSELGKMVAGLPEPQRQVVLLRFGAQLRLEEIADALEIPLGTVKSRLHKALGTLRNELNETPDA